MTTINNIVRKQPDDVEAKIGPATSPVVQKPTAKTIIMALAIACVRMEASANTLSYQRGACMSLMIQKQTAKPNIVAAIVKPISLGMRAS